MAKCKHIWVYANAQGSHPTRHCGKCDSIERGMVHFWRIVRYIDSEGKTTTPGTVNKIKKVDQVFSKFKSTID